MYFNKKILFLMCFVLILSINPINAESNAVLIDQGSGTDHGLTFNYNAWKYGENHVIIDNTMTCQQFTGEFKWTTDIQSDGQKIIVQDTPTEIPEWVLATEVQASTTEFPSSQTAVEYHWFMKNNPPL